MVIVKDLFGGSLRLAAPLKVARGIKDLGGPFVIFRADDKDLKAVLDSFEPHSFGIINVQINPKSGRIF
jgi:hypothetical protein